MSTDKKWAYRVLPPVRGDAGKVICYRDKSPYISIEFTTVDQTGVASQMAKAAMSKFDEVDRLGG